MNDRGAVASSYLFVPANRLDRVEKARRSAADEVIVDLEDAVADRDKAPAREALAELPEGRPVHVRVNCLDSPHHGEDLAAVMAMRSASAVVVPKVESPGDVAAVAAALPPGTTLVALVETARGMLEAEAIASSGVARVMFGSTDYLADIGAPPSPEVLAYTRSRLVVASAAARLPPPVDGPTLVTDDADLVRLEAEAAKALGMGAKLCIHPAQLNVVNGVFRSSGPEREWARAVLEAAATQRDGAFTFEGSMVDEAVLGRARRLLGPDSNP